MKEKKTPIQVHGKRYKNLTSLAKDWGIPPATLSCYRNRTGKSWEEIYDYYQNKKTKQPKFYLEGRGFFTVKEACRYYGFSERAVATTAYLDEIPSHVALEGFIDKTYPLTRKPVKIGTITYPSKFQMLRHFGITASVFNKGSGTEEELIANAYEYRLLQEFKEDLTYSATLGISADKIAAYCTETGILPTTLFTYLREHQNLPLIKGTPCYVQYHEFPSILIACLFFDVPIQTVRNLMHNQNISAGGAITLLLKEKCTG